MGISVVYRMIVMGVQRTALSISAVYLAPWADCIGHLGLGSWRTNKLIALGVFGGLHWATRPFTFHPRADCCVQIGLGSWRASKFIALGVFSGLHWASRLATFHPCADCIGQLGLGSWRNRSWVFSGLHWASRLTTSHPGRTALSISAWGLDLQIN